MHQAYPPYYTLSRYTKNSSVHSIIESIGLVHEACKDHGFQYEPGRVIPCYNVLEGIIVNVMQAGV